MRENNEEKIKAEMAEYKTKTQQKKDIFNAVKNEPIFGDNLTGDYSEWEFTIKEIAPGVYEVKMSQKTIIGSGFKISGTCINYVVLCGSKTDMYEYGRSIDDNCNKEVAAAGGTLLAVSAACPTAAPVTGPAGVTLTVLSLVMALNPNPSKGRIISDFAAYSPNDAYLYLPWGKEETWGSGFHGGSKCWYLDGTGHNYSR